MFFIRPIIAVFIVYSISLFTVAKEKDAYSYLQDLASTDKGIGVRTSGSAAAQKTAGYIAKQFIEFGFDVEIQSFKVKNKDNHFTSNNVIAKLGNKDLPAFVLGAHYDSKGEGSLGAIDNGTGVASMLAIAKIIASNPPKKFSVQFVAFGAEEIAISGSQHYVKQLSTNSLSNIVGMINLDMVAGGDHMYIHSALTKGYPCGNTDNLGATIYNADPLIRQALFKSSQKNLSQDNQFKMHAKVKDYPAGETGPWSDHFPFSCAGIPIAFIESTNFSVNGLYGFDGLAQTNNPAFWDCFDTVKQGACERVAETRWGIILHSKYDRLEKLDSIFPNRIKQQLGSTVTLISEFLLTPEVYLP